MMQTYVTIGYGFTFPKVTKEKEIEFVKTHIYNFGDKKIESAIEENSEDLIDLIENYESDLSDTSNGFLNIFSEVFTNETNLRTSPAFDEDSNQYKLIFGLAMPFGFNDREMALKSEKDLDKIYTEYLEELGVDLSEIEFEYTQAVQVG